MFVVFKRLVAVALVFLCVSASTLVAAKGGRGGGGGSHGGSGSSTDCATHKNQCVKLGKTWMSIGSFVEIIILGVCVIAAIVVVVLTKLGIIKVPQKPGPGTAQAQPDAAGAAATQEAEASKDLDLENQALIPLTPLSPPPTSATASATASAKEMEPLVSSASDQPYGLPPQQTKGLANHNEATFQTLDSLPPPPYHAPSRTTGVS